jgi:predicted anti-sigma-YlaC factor YlaD
VICDPERITGFVDGELEPALASEVAAHLETCPGCRGQAEAERALRIRLRALPNLELPRGLEARVREARRERAFPRRAISWALPAAAVLVLGIWLRGHAPFVAWDLARDHDKCFSRQPLPAVVSSRDPEVLAAWFERQGTRLPALPAEVGELQLVGARYCPLASLSLAPHVYYRSATSNLSVFVVPQGVRLEDRLESETHGDQVLLVRLDGAVVGVVGAREDEVRAFESALRPVRAAQGEPLR